MKPVALIDYGMGNLRSVSKALEAAGAEVILTSNPREIACSGAVVLPGVGAFQRGMKSLAARGLIPAITSAITESKPFLGICLGLQVLFTESEEHGTYQGLNLISGRVKRFANAVKVPHMGWNQVGIQKSEVRGQKTELRGQNSADGREPASLFAGIPDRSYFYFVHSYYVEPEEKDTVLATTEYGGEFASAVVRDNIFGVQFHPEKSGDLGIRLLRNFLTRV